MPLLSAWNRQSIITFAVFWCTMLSIGADEANCLQFLCILVKYRRFHDFYPKKQFLRMVLVRFYRPKSSRISITGMNYHWVLKPSNIRRNPNPFIKQSRTPMLECYDSPIWNTLDPLKKWLPSPPFWKDGSPQSTESNLFETPTLLTQMSNLPCVSAIIFTIAIFCVSWRKQWNNPHKNQTLSWNFPDNDELNYDSVSSS